MKVQINKDLIDKYAKEIAVIDDKSYHSGYNGKEYLLTEKGIEMLNMLHIRFSEYLGEKCQPFHKQYCDPILVISRLHQCIEMCRVPIGSAIIELSLAFIIRSEPNAFKNVMRYDPYNMFTKWIYKFLNPDMWNIYEYLNGIYERKNEGLSLCVIYEKYGSQFLKKVIEHNVPIVDNYHRLLASLSEKGDLETIKYIFSKVTEFRKRNILYYQHPNSDGIPEIDGFTRACKTGNMEIISYLLDNTNIIINAPIPDYSDDTYLVLKICGDRKYRYAPIITACVGGQYEVVKLLLSMFPVDLTKMLFRNSTYDSIGGHNYNLATLSLCGCNEELTRYLIEKHNLELQPSFIYEICRYGTPEMFNYTMKMIPRLLVEDSKLNNILLKWFDNAYCHNNTNVMEHIVRVANPAGCRFLSNIGRNAFLDYCLVKSEYVQRALLEANREFLVNAIIENLPTYKVGDWFIKYVKNPNTANLATLKNIHNIAIHKAYLHLTDIDNSNLVIYPVGNLMCNSNRYTQVEYYNLVCFKSHDDYLISSSNGIHIDSIPLSFSKVNKQMAINSWASIFKNILN